MLLSSGTDTPDCTKQDADTDIIDTMTDELQYKSHCVMGEENNGCGINSRMIKRADKLMGVDGCLTTQFADSSMQ